MEYNPQNPATWLKPNEPLIGADGRDWSWCYVWFKDVVGFPGYKVGWHGTVWSCRKGERIERGYGTRSVLTDEWKRLNPFPNTAGGYLCVGLRKESGGAKQCLVHVLVLEAFICPKPPGLEGCHGPTGQADNRLCNLRWDTHQANIADRDAQGHTLRGSQNAQSKTNEADVARMKAMYASGMNATEISRHFPQVQRRAISGIVRGETWKHVEAATEESGQSDGGGVAPNERVSPQMWRVLSFIADGNGAYWSCCGQSEHGGRRRTLRSLFMRGLIGEGNGITDLGRETLESQPWRKKEASCR